MVLLANAIRQGKIFMKIEKEQQKLFSTKDIIVYIENLKRSTKQLMKINEFSKVAGYRVTVKIQMCLFKQLSNNWKMRFKTRIYT